MDSKKAYVSIELARKLIELHPELTDWVESKVPEIKEYEDEIIRKEIIKFLQLPHPQFVGKRRHEKWIAWLENYKKENTDDKPKPKFKVGDWITDDKYTWKVTYIKPLDYVLQSQNGHTVDDTISYVDEYFRLWSIKDAKEYDILYYSDDCMVMVKDIYRNDDYIFYSYCQVYEGKFTKYSSTWDGKGFKPATENQRSLFFEYMKKAGYDYNSNTKEFKKIRF